MVTVLVSSRTVPPLAISAYDLKCALPLAAWTARIAPVVVVLPWSIWPIVPTLTWGLVRAKFSLAILSPYLVTSISLWMMFDVVAAHAEPALKPSDHLAD